MVTQNEHEDPVVTRNVQVPNYLYIAINIQLTIQLK
jgi:hypothetical protein